MSGRPAAALTVLLCLLAGCGDFAAGVDAYREGRHPDAYAAFRRAEERAGVDADAALVYNRALAALRVENLSDAEASAQRAAARGDAALAASCDFLLGNAAFARCETAARQATTFAAEPFAFDVAITYAEKARRLWELAATGRPDWPEARRNVERALLRVEELRRQKAAAEERRQKLRDPRPRPLPLPPEPSPEDVRTPDESEDPTIAPQLKTLPPERVGRLLDRLVEKEREKLALRRSRQPGRTDGSERDW